MEELHAFRLTPQNLPALAAFMAKACPQWWDEAGAAGQLSGTGLTIGTVGWLLGKDEAHLSGWLLCRELFLYHCLEVECCGFFQQGRFFLEHRLGALFCEAERYARQKGCTALRTAMGSEGFFLHGRPLGNIGQELQALSAPGRQDFHWLLSRGVSPGGHPAARIGPQFPRRASHQRALTPHCTTQRAASAHGGCRAPLSLSRASVRFALQGVKPAFSFAFVFFARKDPLAPFRHISASRRHAPPAFFIFPPHAKAAARWQKQSLSLPQSSCPLRAGAAAGECALHFGPGGSAG